MSCFLIISALCIASPDAQLDGTVQSKRNEFFASFSGDGVRIRVQRIVEGNSTPWTSKLMLVCNKGKCINYLAFTFQDNNQHCSQIAYDLNEDYEIVTICGSDEFSVHTMVSGSYLMDRDSSFFARLSDFDYLKGRQSLPYVRIDRNGMKQCFDGSGTEIMTSEDCDTL